MNDEINRRVIIIYYIIFLINLILMIASHRITFENDCGKIVVPNITVQLYRI